VRFAAWCLEQSSACSFSLRYRPVTESHVLFSSILTRLA
jgi:hypothetical protein